MSERLDKEREIYPAVHRPPDYWSKFRPNFPLFFFFALIATLCDQVWVRLGVLVYPRPYLFGQAWWVPLLFGTVALIAVHFIVLATNLLLPRSTPRPRDQGGRAITAGVWFVAAYLAGGLFDAYAQTLAILLFVIWLMRLWPTSNSIREALVLIFLSLAVAVAGTLGESTAGWLNLMYYPRPDFLRVPYWLPTLWLHAALFARELARTWFWGR
jgi:hypothetical protein